MQAGSLLRIDEPSRRTRGGFVFISYKREEALVAEHVRAALSRAGLAVWWDRQIQCGQAWSAVLDEAVKNASCIVVLWSARAVDSKWVLHEASVALARDNYAPARIDLCSIPAPCNALQATDIIDWNGRDDDPGFQRLTARCQALMPQLLSPLERAAQWIRFNRVAISASVFGAVAIGILVWQTYAAQSQRGFLIEMNKKQASLSDQQARSAQVVGEVVAQQDAAAKALTRFQDESNRSVAKQLERFTRLAEQQDAVSRRLEGITGEQTKSSQQLTQVSTAIDRNVTRGYYPLEPLTLEYENRYPFDLPGLADYVKRIASAITRFENRNVILNLTNIARNPAPRFPEDPRWPSNILPTEPDGPAVSMLIGDNTDFSFVDPKQSVDPDSRSFAPRFASTRGAIKFVCNPGLADAIVKLRGTGAVKTTVELLADPTARVFIKKVRCENPARAGDDEFAFSAIDLIGRRMTVDAADGGHVTRVALSFKFSYEPTSNKQHWITIPDGTTEVDLTPQDIGLQKYDLPDRLRAARVEFDRSSADQKRRRVDGELRRRLEVFVRQFGGETPTFWTSFESAASALDGATYVEAPEGDAAFDQRSFKWLLNEFQRNAAGHDRVSAAVAIDGAKHLFDLLTSVGPDTKADQALKVISEIKQKIFADFGLGRWKPEIPL